MGALSIMQWMQVASVLLSAAPHIREAFAALHPAFDELMKIGQAALDKGAPLHEAHRAAASATVNWLARNGAAAIRTQEQMDGR